MMSEIGMTANRTSRERVGGTIGCSMSAWIETGIMKANLPELKHVSMKRIWTAAAPGGGWESEAAADDGSSASRGECAHFDRRKGRPFEQVLPHVGPSFARLSCSPSRWACRWTGREDLRLVIFFKSDVRSR